MFDCNLCHQQAASSFSTMEELEAHFAAEHLELLPYECESCHFAKFPTEYAVQKHCEKDHRFSFYAVGTFLISSSYFLLYLKWIPFQFRCRITPDVLVKRKKLKEVMEEFQSASLSRLSSGSGNGNGTDSAIQSRNRETISTIVNKTKTHPQPYLIRRPRTSETTFSNRRLAQIKAGERLQNGRSQDTGTVASVLMQGTSSPSELDRASCNETIHDKVPLFFCFVNSKTLPVSGKDGALRSWYRGLVCRQPNEGFRSGHQFRPFTRLED